MRRTVSVHVALAAQHHAPLFQSVHPQGLVVGQFKLTHYPRFILNAVRRLLARIPASWFRGAGRWLTKGRRRRRLYRGLRAVMSRQTLTILQGPMRGLKFTGGESPGWALGASEPAVQDVPVQQLAQGDVFYDVGANVGFFSLLAAKLVGSSGRVYCFEPQPSAIAQLRANLGLNGFTNYEVIEAAVADQRGTARLAVGRGGLWSELTAKLVDDNGGGTFAVDLVALDDLDLPAPRLVKIDVEGAESRVLAGMTRLLLEHRPTLVIELHGTEEPVTRLLQESDYRVEMLLDPGNPHVLATPANS